MPETKKVLITVKTYPSPSTKYDEIVCTAGVMEDGSWIRLYPINFRSNPYSQWYKKYQWVEVDVEKNSKDPRPESYRPTGEVKTLGAALGTGKNWEERKKFVLQKTGQTMCDLDNTDQKTCSLAIIKPREVCDFTWEPVEKNWKPEILSQMAQISLFGDDKKPLEKIPYKFFYQFTCLSPDCKGHKKMIEDWEVGQLYRQMRDKFKDESVACAKVKQRFFDSICAAQNDIYFYVGTVLKFNVWIILGTFYPKKS